MGWDIYNQRVEVKDPGMEMNLGGELAEKLALMLEYEKVLDLGKKWAPVKEPYQDQGMVYGVGKNRGYRV